MSVKKVTFEQQLQRLEEIVAALEKGAETLQTRMAVPASISDIITGILLFCMLGCEFFINFRLIFRKKGHKVQKEAAQ